MPMTTRRLMRCLVIVVVVVVSVVVDVAADDSDAGDSTSRSKRSYYGGFDVYGDEFWYAGRIVGLIAGILLLLLCCCLPCVCLLGIWFLGWFGLRRSRQRDEKMATTAVQPVSYVAPTAVYPSSTPPRTRNVIVESSPRDTSIRNGEQVIYTAEDRYYTSSTGPAPPHRPDAYSTRY